MRFLIDTNICIYIMNNRPPEVVRRLRRTGVGKVGISSITVSELYYGAYKGRHRRDNLGRVEEFLVPFQVLPYDDNASRCYGEIRSDLERRGMVIGPLDLLIAAHALSRDLILITNNEREFKRVESLKVENWIGQND